MTDRVDEVAGDVAHEHAGGHEGILERQGIDLQGHIVDVNEVDAQRGCHADTAWSQG